MRLTGDNLTLHRGGREVFAGLNFSVGAGEALVVTGPNGAGKSSLLRLIMGLLRPAAGRIALDGAEAIGEQAHYLGHQDAVKSALTVRENIRFWSAFLGGDPGSADAALDAVGLAPLADLPAQFLSAGQRRRLALARLATVKRPLWLLDEPTSALDASAQTRLSQLIGDHLRGGGMVMAATHQPLGIDARELKLGAS